MGSELKEEKLEPDRAREVIASEGGQVLDLRDEEEFAEAHIAGAVRAEDDIDAAAEELDEDRPVLVVCKDGKQSAEVAENLRERGYEAAIVKGGIKGWMRERVRTIPRQTDELEGPRQSGPADEENSEVVAKAGL